MKSSETAPCGAEGPVKRLVRCRVPRSNGTLPDDRRLSGLGSPSFAARRASGSTWTAFVCRSGARCLPCCRRVPTASYRLAVAARISGCLPVGLDGRTMPMCIWWSGTRMRRHVAKACRNALGFRGVPLQLYTFSTLHLLGLFLERFFFRCRRQFAFQRESAALVQTMKLRSKKEVGTPPPPIGIGP